MKEITASPSTVVAGVRFELKCLVIGAIIISFGSSLSLSLSVSSLSSFSCAITLIAGTDLSFHLSFSRTDAFGGDKLKCSAAKVLVVVTAPELSTECQVDRNPWYSNQTAVAK